MGSVCQCCCRGCCEDTENDEDEYGNSSASHVDLSQPANHPGQMRVDRESGDSNEMIENQRPVGFWLFLQGVFNGFGGRYRTLPGSEDEREHSAGLFWTSAAWRASAINSPLRTASSFDSTDRGTPTIEADEIVLPGSQLQLDMAKAMASKLESQDDECVICMEGFDKSNPRMPTLCGCGANKTYFHLPCLYQWIDQSESCPSCRQKLTWEEL